MNTSMNTNSLKTYALPIAALLVIIVFVPLIIIPWVGSIQTEWKNLQAKNELNQQVAAKATALSLVDNAVNQELLVAKAEPAMPSVADPSGVLGTLEQIASASGLTAKGSRFADAEAAAGTTTVVAPGSGLVKVNVSVQGTYAGIANFVKQSENIARVLSLESMHIIASPGTAPDQIVATFDVVAPYASLPTDLGPVETPLPDMGQAQTSILDKVAQLAKASYTATPPSSIGGRTSPF